MTDVPRIPESYRAFIESDRLSAKTRDLIEQRIAGPAQADCGFTSTQRETLRAMIDRILPQTETPIDLVGFVIAQLANGKGDGWRFDILPEDRQAYREGLDHLAANHFVTLAPARQDEALAALAAEKNSPSACWFEEVRGAVVAAYIAHPATLARIGYSGLGVGGARTPHRGFVTLGPNEREAWEPLPV